jgi:hypothetical protein
MLCAVFGIVGLLTMSASNVAAHSLCCVPARASAADASGIIRLFPLVAEVDEGGTVTVEVWLEGARGYYGVDLRLHFDATRLRLAEGNVTPLWDAFDPNNAFIIKNRGDNSTGEIWYAVTNINPAEPFTGSGRVCSIPFAGVAPGGSSLTLHDVKGSTRDGDALFPSMVDGAIFVGQAYRLQLPVVASR